MGLLVYLSGWISKCDHIALFTNNYSSCEVPYCRRGIYFYTRQRRDYISLAPLFVNSQINILMKTISYPAAYSYLCLHSRKLWNSRIAISACIVENCETRTFHTSHASKLRSTHRLSVFHTHFGHGITVSYYHEHKQLFLLKPVGKLAGAPSIR